MLLSTRRRWTDYFQGPTHRAPNNQFTDEYMAFTTTRPHPEPVNLDVDVGEPARVSFHTISVPLINVNIKGRQQPHKARWEPTRALLCLPRREPCPKLLHDTRVRQIHRLLALAHLPHLRIASHERQPKFSRLDFGYDSALHLAGEDVVAERQFLAQRTVHTHALDRGESLNHSPHGAETTGDVCSGLGQARDDDVSKIHEKGLALLGRLLQMGHEPLLVSAAGQLDKVNLVGFQGGAELPRLFGLKARFLELDAVDLDTDDEILGDTGANGVPDLEDQPHAVFERTAVFVSTFIGLWAKELR